jgi:hypothetical protein
MNEKIKELLDESTYDVLGVKQVDQQKFAELIIEECASLFTLQFTDEQYQRRIDKTIRKHFELIE